MNRPLRFYKEYITFAEVPNEICLCITIAGCPLHCPDCHSKWLWKDVGLILNIPLLKQLIEKHPNVTCICFMGGDQNPEAVGVLIKYVYFRYRRKYKIAWYSGRDILQNTDYLDYIKVGPYDAMLGPLTSKTTNQKMYQINHSRMDGIRLSDLKDITNVFWKEQT